MVKDNEKLEIHHNKENNKMFIGVVWNCSAELKLLLSALLFISSLITLFQFFPSSLQDLRGCTVFPPPSSSALNILTTTITSPPPPPADIQNNKRVIKRNFNVYGSAAYNFILMSAYRGGADTFAIIGLSSKPLHQFSKPSYICEWVPNNSTGNHENVTGYKILPDWGYGRVYTVVVVNCTFNLPVGNDGSGGRLLVHASTGGGDDSNFDISDTIDALTETPGSFNPLHFQATPKYDYLYCGSPLYGGLSPQSRCSLEVFTAV